jgi:hypothetical protein
MRNRTSVIFSGLGIIALLVALAPDSAAARGGFGGGGFHGGGFHGGGFAGRGFAGGFGGAGFAGSRAMAFAGPGFRSAGVVGRPAWGGAAWRGGWAGGRWAGRPGWRGWGWPVAAGVAAGVVLAAPWGYYGYGGDCTYWDGYGWVNACYGYGPYDYGW